MSEKGELHSGHRGRMLDKFSKHGISAFNEHEMLEILLFMMIPRVNTNEIAHKIIKMFGSLKNALQAPVSELCKINGIGEKSALQLSFIGALTSHLNDARAAAKDSFDSADKIENYFIEHFKDKITETLTLLLLDDKYALLHSHDMSSNLPNHVDVDFREIISQVMKYNVYKLVIAHNHLTGNPNPSGDDLAFTKDLCEYLKGIKVELVDHVVVCKGKALSMRASDYLSGIWEG